MCKNLIYLVSFVLVPAVATSLCSAAIGPVTSVTTDNPPGSPPYNLLSITVGSYTVDVSWLASGTSTTTLDPVIGDALPILDDLDISVQYFSGEPTDASTVYMFGGRMWTNSNGDNPDFFLFEAGGNDNPDFAAILPGGVIGQPVTIPATDDLWGNIGAGYNASNGQQFYGVSFAITDLLDADGNPLTNSSIIEGLAITSRNGLDPADWCAVMPPPALAKDPNPADEATDVPRDVTLSWTPGESAATHDVYFRTAFNDVNDADRSDPRGVLANQGQSPTTYDPPGLLDFGQTYYWRIDEVNAPPSSTIFKGDVWSFTAEPFAYPIAGERITVTASSSGIDQGHENTVNGSGLDVNDQHSIEPTDMWLSSDEPNGAWIEYELDKVYKLHEMWVWNYNGMMEPVIGFGLKDVTIEYSTNGTDYTTLGTTHEFARGTGAPDYAHNITVDFGGVTAKFVRLTANSNWGGILDQYGLSEVRFLYIPVRAREPQPESGATDVAVDVTLGFRAGREADTHDVYLNSDEQAVIDGNAPVATVTETSYGPLSLDLGTTYYWKVNEVNEAETLTTWQGDIWNFTTHEFFIVDGFEDYNDYPPDEIWSTWVDGYGVSANGATVGYPNPVWNLDEHYVETAIVHGGSQSMPFFYDNTGTATYSEGERTFAVPQNWTVAGVQTLVLYFYGTVGNTGQLYVKVNGSKVIYDGDASAIAKPWWTQWSIDLASFGVELQNVTTLAIGIDGSGAGGTLYLDDIRLYRMVPEPAEEIWLEAEAADSITPPMNVYDDPLASGGRYIGTDEGIGNLFQDNPPADGIATYSFTVEAGTYKILFRVIADADTGSNSFWVRIPGATSPQITRSDGWVNTNPMDVGDTWHWDEIHNEDQNENIVHFTLSAGQHTLEIARREDGTLLDAIVITDDVD